MTFHPSVNITEQIADHLAELVVQNELTGGTRIQELKIARELGVSRGSVRESLLILERRHLIEIVPRRGAVVNELRAEEAVELTETLVANEQRLLHRLLGGPDCSGVLAAMGEAVDAMEHAARDEDVRASLQGRARFVAALTADTSRYTRAMFECLLPTSQRVMFYLLGNSNLDLHDIARFYRALTTAVGDRDRDRVDELLKGYQHRLTRLACEAFESSKPAGKPRRLRSMGNGVRMAVSH
jgi:DNA-binding GntR family transcriptional regulator